MPTLLEKIQTDAAQRLSLPAARQPSQELARYRNFLKLESHRLQMLHHAGASGKTICHARASVIDFLLVYILDAVQKIRAAEHSQPLRLALVALGGYGRKELNPQSDIDLMFLHDNSQAGAGKTNPRLSALTDTFLYTLWDIGLKVGHSVRTPADCVRVANSNMQSKTSLIEARLVTGDETLFREMQSAVLAKALRGYEQEYITARLADQDARRAKFGNSALLQEPNIKNGCGGLRDYQNLLWMSYFKYRLRSLQELEEKDLVSAAERKQLESAYDFLLRTRNDLHYQVGRPVDVLSKNLQPTIAHNLGYVDRSPRRRLEHFMRDLYRHMRNIYLITRTVEQRLALLPLPEQRRSLRDLFRQRLPFQKQPVDGFKIIGLEIHPATPRVFRDQPRRLMRVFLYAQQRGLKLHPDLAQLIRNQLLLVDRQFVRDPHVHESFLEILNQRGNVAPILRAMHEVGFLGKYLPEFGRLTCLVQHEFYHQYAADEHTLVCIEKLDQIWNAGVPALKPYAELFQKVERPFLLYLALLLHDAGKAFHTGDHAEVGRRLALSVAKRLGLDGATTHALCLIIEHHLTMIQISQRRDLEDPAVIRGFARVVQTPENLSILTLHTLADSQGTSEQLWNGFKDSLLWSLHCKTMQRLEGGPDFQKMEEKQRELLAQEVRELLPATFNPDEIDAHFANLPARYFQVNNARNIALHVALAHRFMHLQLVEEERALEPIAHWHNEPDRGYSAVIICTWDRAGLFSKIAGSLTAAGLNILSAQIHTRADGIILDTFFVTDAKTGLLANRAERECFERYLIQVLTGDVDLPSLIAKHGPSMPALKWFAERIPTQIAFDNNTSENSTVIEVQAEDRVGLLYVISQAFAEAKIDISLAKICTEKGAAIDSFYLHQANGKKITSPDQQAQIEERLRRAIATLEKPAFPSA